MQNKERIYHGNASHYAQYNYESSGGYESVALQETALSHILNAEGEKIQKMVALPDVTPEVLLATNKSVESMVNAVSRLEMILQSKLSTFGSCLCDGSGSASSVQ